YLRRGDLADALIVIGECRPRRARYGPAPPVGCGRLVRRWFGGVRLQRARRTVETLRDQNGEVLRQQFGQLFGCRVPSVRGPALPPYPVKQLGEPRLAVGGGVEHVEQRRLAGRQAVLLLEPGDACLGRDPAVRLAVDAHEHVALPQVGAVDLGRRV